MTISSDERRAYLALALVPGVGTARLDTLRSACGSWIGALEAPIAFLCTIPTISLAVATAIAQRDRAVVDRLEQALHRLNGFHLTPFDQDYPALFRHIDEPPPLLFGLGRREWLDQPSVAVVGSRHPTSYGIEVTASLAAGLAQAGLVVVSGMARGLDAVAHWAAVRNGGRTIGVLGNGLGVIYPAANAALYQRVGEEGLLLTEFPPGERPHAGSFPRRNRLISGLARVTVVVEAAERSGTLRTASAALDQGREVLAVPGPITSRTSVGTNQLLRASGAAPCLQLEDILEFFPEVAASTRLHSGGASPAGAEALRADLRRVFEALDGAVRSVDGLADELRLDPATVLRAASELEIAGLAEGGAGGFRRAR